MKPQQTLSSQSNLEKEQSWRYHNPGFQDTLQSCSNQNNMELAQKQTWRSMEQNREPINKLTFFGQLIYDEGSGETSLFNIIY